MATCPSCRKRYPDSVTTCEDDGDTLLPNEAFTAADVDLPEGQLVGEYKVEGKIGEGGFGSVYRAVHPLIGKQAAVKVLNRQYSSNPQMVSRFIAEASAVNKIRHRNIIDVFAFGTLPAPDGRQYFIMELLEGMPLDKWLKERGRLPPEEAVPILRSIGRALDAAHAAGIAHRDLKPENVFLTFDEEHRPFPKLLDFGIAKLTGDANATSGAGAMPKTRTGTPMGTPYYMSPEQCRGKDVTTRTDIYSFGIMAHELLTGSLPFTGGDIMELLIKQTSAQPPRVSEVCAELPPAFDEPLLRMMAKEPSARPDSVGAAVEELAAAARQAGFNVTVAPVVRPTSGRTPGAMDPMAAAAAAAAVGSGSGSGPAGAVTPAGSVRPPNRSAADALGQAKTVDAASTPDALTGAAAVSGGRMQTFQGAEADVREPGKKKSGLGVPAIVVGALAVAGGAALVLALGSHPRERARGGEPAPPPRIGAAAGTEGEAPTRKGPPVVVPAAAPPPASSTVSVKIEAKPEDARVFLDGKRIGTAPGPIELPRAATKVTLVFKAEGYKPQDVEVDTSENSTVGVTLVKRPAAQGAQAGKHHTASDIPSDINE